jgi:hypothetical protein
MSTIEDRPTTGERYSSAMESSNLKADADRRGDVDLMIAAGWVPDTLGAMLYRLAVEFDSVRGNLRMGKTLAAIDRFEIVGRLKSLCAVRDELGRLACVRATKVRFMHPDAEVLLLVGRVLDVFLDPICTPCSGRGFTGGGRHEESGPQIICRGCRGTGHRRDNLGRQQDEKDFAADLLADMQARMEGVERMMQRYLRGT